MKALSLWAPWGSFVARGLKRIETRSWPTSHRGPLAIHQTRSIKPEIARLCVTSPHFRHALALCGFSSLSELPLGKIICTVQLAKCVPTGHASLEGISDMERHLGDYSHGRFAWLFEGIVPLSTPVPARGLQGLWDWDGTAPVEQPRQAQPTLFE